MKDKEIYIKDIIRECDGKLISGNLETAIGEFSKDTRTIKSGDTYIGIKGENFNGNLLYEEALEKGANVCIIENNIDIKPEILKKYKDRNIVIVDNSILALQQLAKYKRSLYDIPVIGITGSVGKTSTKDIIAKVLSEKYKVLKTEGNLNNHIGLPLTLLKLKDHNAVVVEMGMNAFGEIRLLTNITKPTMVVITNIGTSHIGKLGSRENILNAKLEIIEGMKENSKIILNNDNDLLNIWANENKTKYNIVTYGFENPSYYMAKNINLYPDGSEFDIDIKNKSYKVNVPISGNHFVLNSLCAISVGLNNDIPIENIINGISKLELTKKRMEKSVNKDGVIIINDTYNASFDSMKAGIESIARMKGNKKIAILGDMLELGEYSRKLHEDVGKEVVKNKIDLLFVLGKEAKNIAKEAIKLGMKNNVFIFDNYDDLILKVKSIINKNDIVFVKASNGMNFYKIVDKLKN